jgi:hypothetical protein
MANSVAVVFEKTPESPGILGHKHVLWKDVKALRGYPPYLSIHIFILFPDGKTRRLIGSGFDQAALEFIPRVTDPDIGDLQMFLMNPTPDEIYRSTIFWSETQIKIVHKKLARALMDSGSGGTDLKRLSKPATDSDYDDLQIASLYYDVGEPGTES